jgi:hypothetical protein
MTVVSASQPDAAPSAVTPSSSSSSSAAAATAQSAQTSVDPRIIAEHVYALMRKDLLVLQERRGKQ